eukprot:TRINITY_DN67637_c0_g1_i1.p1 TRINITY_DN67637_c0_g1~~TRINITY_DN67637_c0_g1_i1.p1  ORF type:complete len:110 (-),score=2.30 TRINITY_DN67637_c0_g1_i1:11-340(-)
MAILAASFDIDFARLSSSSMKPHTALGGGFVDIKHTCHDKDDACILHTTSNARLHSNPSPVSRMTMVSIFSDEISRFSGDWAVPSPSVREHIAPYPQDIVSPSLANFAV